MKQNILHNISDEELIEVLKTTNNVRQALLKVGLTARGANYSRAYNLLEKEIKR